MVVDPKGGVLSQVGRFLQRRGYKIKILTALIFQNPCTITRWPHLKNGADILKFVDTLIAQHKGDGKEGDPFWTKSETLLYCALLSYIIFEGPAEGSEL